MARKKSTESAGSFKAFANENAAVTIGGLTVENGTDRVSISGSVDIAANKDGLEQARALQRAVNAIVDALDAKGALPDSAIATTEAAKPAKRVRNPVG